MKEAEELLSFSRRIPSSGQASQILLIFPLPSPLPHQASENI